MYPELSSSVSHACNNLKSACFVERPWEINKVTCSENYSCKCEANQKFLSQILLRKKGNVCTSL